MFRMKKWGRLSAGVFVPVAIVVFALSIHRPSLLEVYSFGTGIYDRNGALIRLTTAEDERFRVFVPLEEISSHMVDATLLY